MATGSAPTGPLLEPGPIEVPPTPAAGSRRWRTARLCAIAVVILAIAGGALLGSRLDQDPTLVESPLIGQPAPAATLPLLEGDGTVSQTDLRGQIVVVNFWASWCLACREEHPALLAANDSYRDAGVVFVGIDFQDGRDSAITFLDEMGRGEGYRYVTDPGSQAAVDFGVFGVPETFFIDRRGTIVAKIAGPSSLRLLVDTLDAILAGQTPTSRVEGTVQPTPTAVGVG